MARCPTCSTAFEKGEQFCPLDGSPLAAVDRGRDPMLGRVLGGRYRLTERLGQGGMGTVYGALHTLMDKPVAVKILRGELATDAEAVSRFHREARSASRLDHDHCIRVSDFGQSEDGLLYLAMERLVGRSLGERMRAGRLPIDEATAIAYAVGLALEHAHEAGIVHRDLKPDNVFLAQRARGREIVKVLDFGLAKLATDSGKSRSITRDGTVFGTPAYMAPEQAQGDPVDARTDLYSLGVVLFHLLCGELPFRGDTFVAVLTKHVRERPRRPRDLEPSIPPALEAIVLRCLEKRPDERYASASALTEALAPLIAAGESSGPRTAIGVESSGPAALGSSFSIVPRAEPAPLDPAPIAPEPTGDEDEAPLDSIAARFALGLPARRRWRAIAATMLVLALGGALVARRPREAASSSRRSADQAPGYADVERLVATGQLDAAAAELEVLHRSGESTSLERLTAEVAERRGHRLEALAHLHRAKTLAPTDPATRQALAALLLRLGQRPDACGQAERAVALSEARADSTTLFAARGILRTASCDPKPATRR